MASSGSSAGAVFISVLVMISIRSCQNARYQSYQNNINQFEYDRASQQENDRVFGLGQPPPGYSPPY